MPLNVFSRQALNNSVNQGMGFNVQNMIQQGAGQVMQDVEERRQMGRRKYASDMLSQQLQQAQQDLNNQLEGLKTNEERYRFGQEQEYYGGLHTPAGQAALKGYREKLGLPEVGDITTPQGLDVDAAYGRQIEAQKQHEQAVAGEILRTYIPTPGQPDPVHVQWAQQKLGIPSQQAHTQTTTPAAPPAAPRSAAGVFMHEALPTGVGTATGMALASRVPPQYKPIAGLGGFLAGQLGTQKLEGPLSEGDLQEHPVAANLGNVAGFAGSLLFGDNPLMKGVKGLGNRIRGMSRTGPSSSPPGQSMTTSGGPGPATATPKPMPSMGNVPVGDVNVTGMETPRPQSALSRVATPTQRGFGKYPQGEGEMAKVPPPGKRGREYPVGETSLQKTTPPGQRGRGVPQAAPQNELAVPPGLRGREMPGGQPAIINQKIAQFFNLNGRLPSTQELQQLLAQP